MHKLRPSRLWFGLGAAGVIVAIALVWLGVNGLRLARDRAHTAASTRPAHVLPPTRRLPIALWNETEGPVVNLKGDVRLGYEKRPGLSREEVTARVVLQLLNEKGAAQTMLRMFVKRPLPGGSGQLALGELLAAVNQRQAVSPQLSGNAQLVITLGDRKEDRSFRPLSNEAAVPCEFR